MAIDFLSSIDLNKNELQNGVIHVLASAPSNPVEGQIYYNSTDNRIYFYDGTSFVDASGDIKSVQTTTPNQLTITDPNGPNPSLAIVTGVVTNSGTALATGDQIYDFVYGVAQEVTINGTTNEIEVTTTGGSAAGKFGPSDTITVGLPNDVTIGNNLTVTNNLSVDGNVTLGNATTDTVTIAGDLTVNGTTTSVNSNTVNIGDNIIVLNSDETGTPSQDAGIEVERGTGANRSLIWDESDTNWKIQQSGGTYERISTYADSVEDVTVTETAGSGIAITETLSGTDNRIKEYNLSVDLDDLRYKASIGDGSSTSIAVTHNLGTRDVIVQLYDNSSYDTVFADVVRNTTNQVTISFGTAPATNGIRVLVQKQ